MNQTSGGQGGVGPHRIELNLQSLNQLFNTMDPSPFHEKDLDHDAEEFIVSWMREFSLDDPVWLVVHLNEFPRGEEPQPVIEKAVQNYFAYRSKLNRLEFKHLMRDGRQSLITGLLFLTACLAASSFLAGRGSGAFESLARESLTIAGWVAMWRPMEIYLYDWWPLSRRGKLFEKLSRIRVEVRKRE